MGKETSNAAPSCASCDLERAERICWNVEGKGSRGCPTLTRTHILDQANQEYESPEIQTFARMASLQEAECYANRHQRPYVMQPSKTRIVEICEFAHKMNYKKLGLAFCVGLAQEAKVVEEVFQRHGFMVVSVLCKAGRTSKKNIGIKDEQKIYQGTEEAMCNPIFQAKVLNHDRTDLNVLLGLCVGHDSLFFRFAEAPTTVLAVKDRVTGHNPLAAVYLSHSYYRKVMHPEVCSPGHASGQGLEGS